MGLEVSAAVRDLDPIKARLAGHFHSQSAPAREALLTGGKFQSSHALSQIVLPRRPQTAGTAVLECWFRLTIRGGSAPTVKNSRS